MIDLVAVIISVEFLSTSRGSQIDSYKNELIARGDVRPKRNFSNSTNGNDEIAS